MDPRFAVPSGGPLSRVTSGAGHAEDTAKDTANTRGNTERGCQGGGWGGHQSGVGESWGPAGWLTELLWVVDAQVTPPGAQEAAQPPSA